MARKNPKPPPLVETLPALSADGTYGAIAVAEQLEPPNMAAVLVFVVGGGDTRLIAHAVLPAPDEWPTDRHSVWLMRVGFALSMTESDDRESDRRRLVGATQVTSRIVRGVTTGELERWARQHIASDPAFVVWGRGGDRKHRNPRGGGDRRLAEMSARYVELLSETERPNPQLAKEFNLSLNTVSSYLFRARERDLLTSPGRGRAGGALTTRARALLTEEED